MLGVAVATAAALAGCPLFGSDFSTNQRVDTLPVAADSNAIVRSIGLGDGFHADFGSGRWEGKPIGIPYTVVEPRAPGARACASTTRTSPTGSATRSRAACKIEGGGDRHALLVDRSSCKLYELYALRREGGGWRAGSGATWNLRRPKLRPRGVDVGRRGRPADPAAAGAAGQPADPPRAAGDGVRDPQRVHVCPARHFASDDDDPSLPRMGERLRLKASVDISGLPRQARRIARAMQAYGLIVADNGSDWYVSGVPSARWDNDQLHALDGITGRDFEVVDTGR